MGFWDWRFFTSETIRPCSLTESVSGLHPAVRVRLEILNPAWASEVTGNDWASSRSSVCRLMNSPFQLHKSSQLYSAFLGNKTLVTGSAQALLWKEFNNIGNKCNNERNKGGNSTGRYDERPTFLPLQPPYLGPCIVPSHGTGAQYLPSPSISIVFFFYFFLSLLS